MQVEFDPEDQKAPPEIKRSPGVFADLDRSRKIALAILAFLGFFVFIFGVLNIRNGIYGPFQRKTVVKQESDVSPCADGNCADASDEEMKNKDTDKDGLSDYDELNSYKTSPYLEDSDSDGFSDKEEIANNKDPNCPVGRECAGNVLVNGDANLVNPGVANNIDLEEESAGIASASGTKSSVAPADMDAPTLRRLLSEAGVPKSELDKVSDQELLAEFEAVLSEEAKAE